MAYQHIEGVKVRARFSEENGLRFRYRLDITLENNSQAGKTVCVVMQNPSYASESVADKSVQFMEKVIFLKGLQEFAGVRHMIVVNQFARIQTNNFQGSDLEIGSRNNAAIRSALKAADIIVLGWGSGNRFTNRQVFVLREIEKLNQKTVYKTKSHPSRAGYDGFILPYP